MNPSEILKQVRELERSAQFTADPPVPFYKLRYPHVLWQPPATKQDPYPDWVLRKDLRA